MKRGYIDLPQGQIHYRTEGSGQSVLLLHQAPLSSEEYSGVIPRLGQHFRVIAVDAPGHGSSDDPAREYEVADYAQSIIDFLTELGINNTNIVGHHSGAAFAVQIAVSYPDRVNRMVLSGFGLPPPEPKQPMTKAREYLSKPMSRKLPITEDGNFLMETWERYQHLVAPTTSHQVKFRPFIIGLEVRLRPYDAHDAVFRANIKSLLGQVKCPTLLISGREDIFATQEGMEYVQSMIPDCTLGGFIDGGGAMVCFERPEEFARAVINFLER